MMKTLINNFLTGLFFLGSVGLVNAQCPNNNIQFGTSSAPTVVNQQQTLSFCMYGGEYRLVTGLVAGSQYNVQTCGDFDFDTQITVYDAVTGAFVAYNDDACGLQSSVNFVSNGNPVRVLIDRYFCANQSSCMTLRMTRLTGGAPAPNPCNIIVPIACGDTKPFSLSGAGAFDCCGPWGTPGEEQIYSFTPTVSGAHSISVTNSGYYVDLFVSTSCGPTGWTYIDDIFSSSTNSVTLNAGVTYYFMIDDENTSPSNGSITVNCPTPAVDPCTVITDITNCDQSYSYSLGAGNGLFNCCGPWGTPGKEAVFSYTAPVSGSYEIDMTHSGGGWTDIFISTSCGPTGWTYIDDVFSSASNTVNLTGGVTYYFLLDDENTSPSSGTININCPCIGPANGIDGSYVLSGNTTINGDTDGACNDCSFRSSEDQTWEVTIPCPGVYSFTTCGLATWDTYLYLSSSPCSGILALNDDACGLRSKISYNFASAGTYYVTVEGFSSFSKGAYGLQITRDCDLSASLSPTVQACGYNITCNGASDGEINVNASGCGNLDYVWSDGSTGSSLTGVPAGTYSVTITDDWGCTVDKSETLTEPDALVVDAGNDQVVYYGYTPLSCVDVDAAVAGGCPSYDYVWSAGGAVMSTTDNLTDCPTASTQYMLQVTDQNGCTATDYLSVCVIDVRCWAGNSGNQKVEMCQVPPGNPANAHTICIDESAVPAHLAIGCTLGACDEADDCNNASKSVTFESYTPVEVAVSPNPFTNEVEIFLNVREKDDYTISIFDTYGKKVAEVHQGILEAFEYNSYKVSLAHLAPGVYIVGVDNGKSQQVNARIIKQ